MMSWIGKIFCILLMCCSVCNARSIKEADVANDTEKTPITLDQFLSATYASRTFNGSWISDTEFLYRNSGGDVIKYNAETQTGATFFSRTVLTGYTGASFSLSEDQSYVLIRYNVTSVFRHSTTASYAIYDIANEVYYNIEDGTAIQLAAFAPTGHRLVYVYNNNIYYLEDFAVDISNPVTVTTVGETGIVYCGVPDWVYEEEVLGSGSALWFSPNATYIAYAVFHDENVANFSYYIYGTVGSLTFSQYPTEALIKYPKVGTTNPLVNIYVYNLDEGTTVEFQLPASIDNKATNDYVLYDLTWVTTEEVAMISTNRIQNESITIRCEVNGQCREEDSYSEEKGWVNAAIPRYNSDGTKKIEILPQPEDDDYFYHIVLTDTVGNTKTRLTYGKRVVTSIYGWDLDRDLIYYVGTFNNSPSQQQVYVVSTAGEDKCLTCEMLVENEPCLYASAAFSKSLSYHVKTCSGPNPAWVQVDNSLTGETVIVLRDNEALRTSLLSKQLPIIKYLSVPINDDFEARVKLFLPPNLDETATKKYPAIVYTYAGPDSAQVYYSYSVGIQYYFTTSREYIYIFIDGRGTGRDGQKRMFSIYKNLATLEIEDQLTVTKYLQDNLPYIDANRTGIWGWSYGGFASTWALIRDTEHVFNFALAVAPVTSFIYYDTIYTERYMGLPTPEDNEIGYNNTDTTRMVEALRGRRYFIIHGNADDNVHYQNAMALIKALEYADIEFRQMSYPDENHSLTYVRKHLYHTLDSYFARCFDLESPPITVWNHKKTDF